MWILYICISCGKNNLQCDPDAIKSQLFNELSALIRNWIRAVYRVRIAGRIEINILRKVAICQWSAVSVRTALFQLIPFSAIQL
jgi:hypothetical protein